MKHSILFHSACAMALCAAPGALAQSATATNAAGVADVGEVLVTVTRSPVRRDQVGSSLTIIDLGQIQDHQTVIATDLLVQTPGVTFSRNGGVGKATSLSIRGAETDQTVVLIDGVKLNDPSSTGGGFSSGNLLLGDIARIEVLRGAHSTLWGSQAIGGVINMVTREPAARLEADFTAEGGSFNTAYLKGGAGGRTERLIWRVGAGYYTSDGVTAFARGVEDDGYRNLGANGRAVFNVTQAFSLEGRAVYSKGRNQFDSTTADTDATGETTELIAYGGANLDLLRGRFKNRVSFAYTDTERMNWTNSLIDFDAAGKNRRWEYQGNVTLAEGHLLTFGAEHERSEMRSASPTPTNRNPVPVRGEVGIDGFYGQIVAEVLPGLTLTGGLRHDKHSNFGGHTLGQAAVAYSINDGDTVFRASYGEGFKAPSLFQQYSDFGNIGLKPEEAKSWDVGFEHHVIRPWLVSATIFERRTDNLIVFVSCTAVNRVGNPLCNAPRTAFYNNVSKATAKGVELGSSLNLGAFTAGANSTYQRARDETPGANLGKRLVRRAGFVRRDGPDRGLWPDREPVQPDIPDHAELQVA